MEIVFILNGIIIIILIIVLDFIWIDSCRFAGRTITSMKVIVVSIFATCHIPELATISIFSLL